MVVAAAAGGPIDVFARIMAERMSPAFGQRVVIENVGGGGGTLGAQRVVRAEPDGYTTLLGTIATHANPQLLTDKPPYDPVADFTPVALIAEIPLILITRKDFPANTFEEFVAYAKANQDEDELWLGRCRLRRASRLRDARSRDGHQHHPRSLSRHGPGDAGPGRRADRFSLRDCRDRGPEHQVRQREGAREPVEPALPGAAGSADRGGEGLAVGAGLHLDRGVRAEGDAGRRLSQSSMRRRSTP